MSSDETPQTPSPRDAVREKAQKVHARQSKARVLRRASLITASVAVVAAVAVVVTWTIGSAASKPMLSPGNMAGDGITVQTVGAIASSTAGGVGDASPTPSATAGPAAAPSPTSTATPVDIRVYVDYLSPGSSAFQIANAAQLAGWVRDGAASITYHPVALLTPKSNGTKYSLRAASAAACVATYAPGAFFAFNGALLTRQPDVNSDGFSDAQLADIAIASGAASPKLVRACIEAESFAAWAQDATKRAVSGPLPGTEGVTLTAAPTILVNGVPYSGALDSPKEFAQFVLTLSSDAYTKSLATPTPTPTP